MNCEGKNIVSANGTSKTMTSWYSDFPLNSIFSTCRECASPERLTITSACQMQTFDAWLM